MRVEVDRALSAVTDPSLRAAGRRARAAVGHAEAWLEGAWKDPARLEAGAGGWL